MKDNQEREHTKSHGIGGPNLHLKRRFWNWLKAKLRRKKPLWIKKKVVISYWTHRDYEAEIEIPEIKFKPANQQSYYVDTLHIEREEGA